MFNLLFGNGKIKNALRKGAAIIDLRPPRQFDEGRIPDSINIPIDRIPINVGRIEDMKVPIILCGYSDDVSKARHLLLSKGLKEVYDGGSWTHVLKILQSL